VGAARSRATMAFRAALLARACRLRGDQDVRHAGLLVELRGSVRRECPAREAAEDARVAPARRRAVVVALARSNGFGHARVIDPEFSNEVAIEEPTP
jgi:hypothetical protein